MLCAQGVPAPADPSSSCPSPGEWELWSVPNIAASQESQFSCGLRLWVHLNSLGERPAAQHRRSSALPAMGWEYRWKLSTDRSSHPSSCSS